MSLLPPVDGARTVGIVTGGHFLSHFYLLVLPPLFPLLRADLGLTNAELGLLVSVISAATLLQVPFGELVDRTGAKPVFVAGVGTTGLGIALAGLAESYLAILAFVLVSGIGQATFHPADYPLVEAVSDAGREGRNFSVHTFGGYVGFAAAPVLAGGALADRYDPDRVIPAVLAVAALGLWLVASGVVPVGAPVLIGVFAIVGGAYGLVFPARDRLVSEFSDEGSTGRSFGFVFTGTAISGSVDPVLLGAVIDAATVGLAFLAIGAAFLAAGALVAALRGWRGAGVAARNGTA